MLTKKNNGNINGWQIVLTLLVTILITAAVEGATGTVNYNTVYQQLEGFGGAAVYDCPNLTTHPKKEEIYDLLFKELGIEILRIRNTYGYTSDPTGSQLAATAAIIAEAREPNRSPGLKVELVPWSPPSYLKSNGNENSGGTLAKSGGVYRYNDYANWWYDSLRAWEANGVVPNFISLQNEPDWYATYDSCRFNPTESDANAGYDQAFQAVYNKLHTEMGSNMPKMWAPETMGFGGSTSYITALNNIGQLGNVYGFSHHLYSDGSYDSPDGMITGMTNYYNNYGYKPLNMTEYVKNGVNPPNFDMAWKFAWHIYNCLYYEHVKSYFNWTLFRQGTSADGKGGGIVTYFTTGDYTIRPQYWYLKAYSHFTGKDWYVLNTSVAGTTSLRMSAFKDPDDDQLTVVILNTSGSSISLTSLTLNDFTPCSSEVYQSWENNYWVDLGEFSGSLTLPAYSITTIHMTRALKSDINCDCYVDYEDLGIIADNWLRTNCTEPDNCEGADFAPTNGKVDFFDFASFAEQWLWCSDPENPSCDNW